MRMLSEKQLKLIKEELFDNTIQGTDLEIYFLIRDLQAKYGEEILTEKIGDYSLKERCERMCKKIMRSIVLVAEELGIDYREFRDQVGELTGNTDLWR